MSVNCKLMLPDMEDFVDYIGGAFILTRCNPMLVDISVSPLITETVSN